MKVYLLTILTLLSFCCNTFSWAKDAPIAKVSKIHGNVTILAPGARSATLLKQNNLIFKDSSILSGEKSFAQIQFNNGATTTVGPNSKIVIQEATTEENTLIDLVRGQIRASVNNDEPKAGDKKPDLKFFIKTRTASMAVRGTEFQMSFEPSSLRTGLLTFNGEVVIKKATPDDKNDTIEELKKELSNDVQLSKKGDFSYVNAADIKMKEVTKIDPVQFVLLKTDESMGTDKSKVDMVVVEAEAKKVETEYVKEGVDLKKVSLVDTHTAFVVPTSSGKVDDNGQFIAPNGLKLDAKKGFVTTTKDDQVAINKAIELNKVIEDQTVTDVDNAYYRRYFDVK
jgi:hypothetical protein